MKKIISLSLLSLSFVFSTVSAQTASTPVQDNNTDETTVNTCIDINSKVLKYRGRDADTNGEVSLLQDYLNSKGLFAQGATGFYGLKTVDAVKKFQKSNGILASGTVGSLTKKITGVGTYHLHLC